MARSILKTENYHDAKYRCSALAVILFLSACQTTPTPEYTVAPVVLECAATPELTDRARFRTAIDLLQRGEECQARAELAAYAAANPQSQKAQTLLDSIDSDPTARLGAISYDYIVRRGDSLSKIAEAHLGDQMEFYSLAKYNGLSDPTALLPGTRLRIPGEKPKAAKTSPPSPKVASSRAASETPNPKIAAKPVASTRSTSEIPPEPAPEAAPATVSAGSTDATPPVAIVPSAKKILADASAAWEAAQYTSALQQIDQAYETYPDNRSVIRQGATANSDYAALMIENGDLGAARSALSRARVFANHPAAEKQSKRIAALADAITTAEKKLEIDAALTAADARAENDPIAAMDEYQNVILQDPDNAIALARLDEMRPIVAQIHYQQGEQALFEERLEDAERALTKAVNIEPANVRYRDRLDKVQRTLKTLRNIQKTSASNG